MRLPEVIRHYEPPLLAEILHRQGWPAETAPASPEDMLRRLSDPKRLKALWTQLPPEGRVLIEGLRRAGGAMPALVFSILYEMTSSGTPGVPFETLAVRLAASGMIYWYSAGRPIRSLLPQGAAILPVEIAAALPPLEVSAPSKIIPASPLRLARDLGRFGRFLRRFPEIALTREGRLPARWMRRLQRWLGWAGSPQESAYLTFLQQLLERMGVLRTHGAALILDLLHPFWEQGAIDRALAAFHVWKGEGSEDLPNNGMLSPGLLRARVEQALCQQEPGSWIPLPCLLAAVFPERPERLPDPSSPAGREMATHLKTWLAAETLWPLHWLGLLDRGDGEGRWQAVRLTPFGAWVLGIGGPVSPPEEGGRLIVQPDFRILVFEPASESILAALETFADPSPGDPVSVYQLSRDTVYRGIQQGWDVPRIIRFLEGISGEPLPSNVRRSLEDWHRRFHQIRIYRRVTLIRTAGEPLPRGRGIHPLGDSMGWTEEPLAHLEAEWYPQGIRPWTTGFRPEDLRHQVIAEPPGILRWAGPFPHPGVERLLEPFAERIPEGFRITEESVRAGRTAGMTLPQILQRLQQVHRGPLPAWLLARLLAWSDQPPRARWEHVILLRMDRPEILEALWNEPELAPWIRPLDSHTLMVRADHASALKAWLEAIGVSVEEMDHPSP
ncbi:helicase-associated domain-containing protein [Thermoflexus sp.]|uniref:helicase-associated domain-containing protein n=1 Tax=Thermoflexus sp. TaxID=1969742 RepID=UPI002ADE910B|nr:helicase-associated domain-containing protein [Thermoflexus sp.]